MWPVIIMAEPIPDEPEPQGASHPAEDSGAGRLRMLSFRRSSTGLLDQVRTRFKELAASCVKRCELKPEMACAVLHSLELGLAQMIKEDGRVMQRQFRQDVEGAVKWAAENLIEACRHLATGAPGRPISPLQSLAFLEVQALEFMLPELSQADRVEAVEISVPAADLQSFCGLLNDALDLAQKAENAAARQDQPAYRRTYALSRIKLRNAARMLRRMLGERTAKTDDLTIGLRGFQLELAAHTGSLRMFLKALCAQDAAIHRPRHHAHVVDPHCLVGDLLPTLFDRHFAFTILTPHGAPVSKSQELMDAAHEVMWQKVGQPVTALLDHPGGLHPAKFKDAVDAEVQKAIKEVNEQFAAEGVVVSITSSNTREITRRQW